MHRVYACVRALGFIFWKRKDLRYNYKPSVFFEESVNVCVIRAKTCTVDLAKCIQDSHNERYIIKDCSYCTFYKQDFLSAILWFEAACATPQPF
jgi:hypothetical protein